MRCGIVHVEFDEDQARMFVGHARLQMGQTPGADTVFKNSHIITHPLGGVRDGVFDLTRLIYLILPAAVSHIV